MKRYKFWHGHHVKATDGEWVCHADIAPTLARAKAMEEALQLAATDIEQWQQLAIHTRRELGDRADFTPRCPSSHGIERSRQVVRTIAAALAGNDPAFTPLPAHLRGKVHNNGQECDMLKGPCACGAWHDGDAKMSEREEWKAGECLECTDVGALDSGHLTVGKSYKLHALVGDSAHIVADDSGKAGAYYFTRFRRPVPARKGKG